MTSAIPVRCSTNWAMKPHIGSEVNLLSSYLPVQWNDEKFVWNNSYCLNWKIYCDDHSSLSSTTAVQIWIISYKLLIIRLVKKLFSSSFLRILPICNHETFVYGKVLFRSIVLSFIGALVYVHEKSYEGPRVVSESYFIPQPRSEAIFTLALISKIYCFISAWMLQNCI